MRSHGKEKGPAAREPRPEHPPNRIKEVAVTVYSNGGSGVRRQSAPDPHRPHSPKPQGQGVCW